MACQCRILRLQKRMPLRERDKFSSFLFLWKSAGFCLPHLLCTSQFKIKHSCCNFNIKHIPETPYTGLLAVFSTQSVSLITVMVWENLFIPAIRPGSFSKARAYKGGIERPKGMVGHIQLTVSCACGAGMGCIFLMSPVTPGNHIHTLKDQRETMHPDTNGIIVLLAWV